MVEKMLVASAGTLATALIAVSGWNAVHRLIALAWAWRTAITAHAAWSN